MAEFRSNCSIDSDTRGGVWVPGCLPVLQGKGGGSNLVPFHPCDVLSDYLDLFNGYYEILIYGLIGICSDGQILTHLSCGYKGYHLVGSDDLFNLDM